MTVGLRDPRGASVVLVFQLFCSFEIFQNKESEMKKRERERTSALSWSFLLLDARESGFPQSCREGRWLSPSASTGPSVLCHFSHASQVPAHSLSTSSPVQLSAAHSGEAETWIGIRT